MTWSYASPLPAGTRLDARASPLVLAAFWAGVLLGAVLMVLTTVIPAHAKARRLARAEAALAGEVAELRRTRDDHHAHLQAFGDPRFVTEELMRRGYRLREMAPSRPR